MTQAASLAPMGVSFEEFGAMVATITKQTGGNTAEAMTKITSLIKALGNEATPTAKKLKELGVQTGISRIRNEGLSAVLADVQKATGGHAEVLGTLSMRKETNSALLMLLGENYDDLTKMIETNRQATGATAEAYGKMANTTGQSIDMFQRLKDSVLADLGERVLPLVNDALQRLSTFLQENGKQLGDSFEEAAQSLYQLGEWVVRNAKQLAVLVGGIFATKVVASFLTAVKAVTVAIGSMGAAGAGIGTALVAALGSPVLIASAVAAGALIGDAIGTAIGKNMTEQVEARGRELEKVVSAQAKRLQGMLGGRGVSSMADLTKQEGRFRSGEILVPGAGISATGGMVGSFGDAMTPAEFVKTHGAEAAREMVAMNNVLREELQRAAEERAEIARQVFEQAREEFEMQGEILAQMEEEAAGAGSGYAAAEMAESLSEQRALVDGLRDSVAGNHAAYEEATRAADEYARGVERAAANVKKAIDDLDDAAGGDKKPPIPKINIGRKKKKGKPISDAELFLASAMEAERRGSPRDLAAFLDDEILGTGSRKKEAQLAKKRADQRADTEHALNVRLATIRGDYYEVERLEEERRFADESERFKGFADAREELERAHQD
ncbi:MAG: phage tail tape measure protein, partial [Pseudomonadota bacterium]|nr:phage tail tape measure protein [Pseudomonadota bacterium]